MHISVYYTFWGRIDGHSVQALFAFDLRLARTEIARTVWNICRHANYCGYVNSVRRETKTRSASHSRKRIESVLDRSQTKQHPQKHAVWRRIQQECIPRRMKQSQVRPKYCIQHQTYHYISVKLRHYHYATSSVWILRNNGKPWQQNWDEIECK